MERHGTFVTMIKELYTQIIPLWVYCPFMGGSYEILIHLQYASRKTLCHNHFGDKHEQIHD